MSVAAKQNRRSVAPEPAGDGIENELVGSPATYADGAVHASLPSVLTAEIGRLFGARFSLLPLGGDDGKKPIVGFKDRGRLPLSLVLDRMAAAGSHTFGIRLTGLLVVDVDTDTPEARAYVEQRFGTSSASTKTSRGFHLYFRHDGRKPATVDLPGIKIDFKAGPNEFVVGALSARPDGTVYQPVDRLVSATELPLFSDRDAVERNRGGVNENPRRVKGRVPSGSRWTTLRRRGYQLALVADTFDNLLADLLALRDWEVERPEEFSDNKVEGLARWFWDLRESGQLYSGRSSGVLIQRSAIELIASAKGERSLRAANITKGTASLLYNMLLAEHGHLPGVSFAVVPDALRKSGRMSNGRRQIYDAIDLLIELGLLVCISQPEGYRDHYLYQLGVTGQAGSTGRRGGGSNLTLVSVTDTQKGLAS